MLEKITYKNHINEEINFGENNIFVNTNDLHDFSWSHTSKNDRISAFKTGVVKKTIPVIILCNSEEDGIRLRNKLYECAEKDLLALKYGKIIIGDYYFKCYISGSKKTDYLIEKRYMKASLTIVSDLPMWVKETTTTFGYGSAGKASGNMDFNNDFPMDYTSNILEQTLNNTGFVDCNFKIRIYGACENPEVVIAGHTYKVNASVELNEYLEIDSIEKTIILTHADGTKKNCFNLRSRDSYIFQKIPPGISFVSKGEFKFDVTIFEERSEPKWI